MGAAALDTCGLRLEGTLQKLLRQFIGPPAIPRPATDAAYPDAAVLSEALVRAQAIVHRVGGTAGTGSGSGGAGGGGGGGGGSGGRRAPRWPLYGPSRPGDAIAAAAEEARKKAAHAARHDSDAAATAAAVSLSSAGGSSSGGSGAVVLPPLWCPALFPCRWGRFYTLLYHGTSPDMADRIGGEGFRRPVCRLSDSCKSGECCCQMEGFAVYFADRDKATFFATKRAAYNSATQTSTGGLLVVAVDVGVQKLGVAVPCPCGCGKEYVDHWGAWYSRQGADTLYLRDYSLPATRTAEWAVADPARCVILRVEHPPVAGEALERAGSSGAAAATATATTAAAADGQPPAKRAHIDA